MTTVDQLSVRAQAILAAHWGMSPGLRLTLQNVESRLTAESAEAIDELVSSGFLRAIDSEAPGSASVTYTLTEGARRLNVGKSMSWLKRHGRFPLTEPILAPRCG